MSPRDWWEFVSLTRPPAPTFVDKDYPDLSGKVFLVTGGASGIGNAVVKKLLGKNAKVWILGRRQAVLDKCVSDLKEEFPKAQLDTVLADLSDLPTIKPAAELFLKKETKLNGIIHNAGVMNPPEGAKSKQGYEIQLGTNDIGPFLLQEFLDDLVIATAKKEPANTVRILWVSSMGHYFAAEGGVNWDDINYEKEKAGWTTVYGQSKAIDIYLSYMWAKKHPGSGVVSISCHPGLLNTELDRYHKFGPLMRGMLAVISPIYPPAYGAFTELFAVLSPSITTKNDGNYVNPWGRLGRIRPDVKEGMEGENGEKVWKWLKEQVSKYE
ncbi:DEKNAAC105469 [Brettanomyces naardenensis]|uniref:DEKNAAC105469 n=1 Tax=Brettanomyces naardenensis TaxID=13370 RepID=A0A448YTI6_BRENA|nr:DEKNAAC105469 [Brettanomyces naardenensis]